MSDNKSIEVVPQASQSIIDAAKRESHQWLNPETWRTMGLIADTFLKSGAMPKSMDTAPKLMVALQAGKEAGLQPLEAINSFYFVNGKVSIYGDMAIAQVLRAGHKVEWGKCDDKTATVKITRGDNGASNEATFTMQMAIDRGMTSNAVYKKYPENMLRFKAFHACAKFIVSDALHGVPVKEIIEAETIEEMPIVKTIATTVNTVPSASVTQPKLEVSLEEALAKEPEKVEALPAEPKTESKGMKAMREAKEKTVKKAKEEVVGWPEDVCRFLRFIEGIPETELQNDILDLKVDALKENFRGYEAYPNLVDEIAKVPEDFK